MEEWKSVIGYENLYEVSSHGNVRRVAPWCDGRKTKPAPGLIGMIASNGYRRITLRKDMKQVRFPLHRLVALAFIGPAPSGRHQVNHINGNKTDNRPENLEYVTPSENQFHSYRILKSATRPGSKHHNAKISEADVITIRSLWANGKQQKELGAMFGISQPTISEIVHRKMWKHI